MIYIAFVQNGNVFRSDPADLKNYFIQKKKNM